MSNIDNDDCEDDINDGISPPTPGPWKVVTSWYDYSVEGPNDEEIIWQDGPYQTPTIKLSDARLIAAAPEMYELIKTGVRFLQNVRQYHPLSAAEEKWEQNARELMAKIDGGGDAA